MNLSETANLIVNLKLKDEASGSIKTIQGNISGLDKTLTSTGTKFKNFSSGIVQGFGQAFGQAAVRVVSEAGRAVTDFIGGSIEAASNLNETLSKSGEIFGKNEQAVESWAKTASTSMGLSERAALDAASGFAGLFQTVGDGLDQATEQSQKLTQLGADLASFFNTDMATALDAIKSGLSGESEPLRQFNIFLSETAVSAKAAQLGFQRVNGQFTENAKVAARYAIILEQTGTAQGDFVRTSDGLANSQRILAAEMENTQAAIGEHLLPLELELNKAFLAGVEAVGAFASAYEDAKNKFVVQPGKTFLDSLPSQADAQAALTRLDEMANDASKTAQYFSSPFDKALFDANIMGVKDAWQHQVDDINYYLKTQAFDGTGKAIKGALTEQMSELARTHEWLSPLNEAMIEAATVAAHSFGAHITFGRGSSVYANWVKDAFALGQGTVSALTQGMLDEQGVLDTAVKTLQDAIKNGITPNQLQSEAEGRKLVRWVEKGLASEKIGVKETAEGIAGTAIKAIVDGAQNGALGGKDAKAAGRYLADLANAGIHDQALEAFLAGKGLSAKQIAGLVALFPQYFKAGQLAAAQFNAGFAGQIRHAPGSGGHAPPSGGTSGGGGGSGGTRVRAGGGPVVQGFPYIVGEQGAEMFVPGANGTIVSNAALRGLMGLHRGDSKFFKAVIDVTGRILDETGMRRVDDLRALRQRLERYAAHGNLGPQLVKQLQQMLRANLGQIDSAPARQAIHNILGDLKVGTYNSGGLLGAGSGGMTTYNSGGLFGGPTGVRTTDNIGGGSGTGSSRWGGGRLVVKVDVAVSLNAREVVRELRRTEVLTQVRTR